MALVPLLVLIHRGSPGPGDPARAPRGVRWAPWIMGIVYYALTFWWIVLLLRSASVTTGVPISIASHVVVVPE